MRMDGGHARLRGGSGAPARITRRGGTQTGTATRPGHALGGLALVGAGLRLDAGDLEGVVPARQRAPAHPRQHVLPRRELPRGQNNCARVSQTRHRPPAAGQSPPQQAPTCAEASPWKSSLKRCRTASVNPWTCTPRGGVKNEGSSRSVKSIVWGRHKTVPCHVRRCRVAFTPRGSERRDPGVTTVILHLERLQVRPACPGAEMMLMMLEARMGSAH